MKKASKIFFTSALLPFVFACNEAPVTNVSTQQAAPEKQPSAEQNQTAENQKKWTDAKDSTNKALQQSKKAGEDIWDASKGSSKELWQEGQESSKDIWQDSKEAGSEIWDDLKNKSSDVWEKGNKAIDEMFNSQQPATKAQENEDEI